MLQDIDSACQRLESGPMRFFPAMRITISGTRGPLTTTRFLL